MGHEQVHIIPAYTQVPFVLLLLSIAVLPLWLSHIWDNNRNKAIISALLSAPVLVYLLIYSPQNLLHTVEEYVSFIALLGALFVISGNILLTGDIQATPKTNTAFLAAGAFLANFMGTTGASMLLIRPLIRTNSERKHTTHTFVFFIFLVSNLGGMLTPLGDPPLFLGYLRGVPFAWTLKLFPVWAFSISALLLVYYVYDSYWHRHEEIKDLAYDKEHLEPLRFHGKHNFLFLLGVVLCVLLQLQSPYREVLMILFTVLSYALTDKKIREQNNFSFHPIEEVAILFAGIFITMVPALLVLHAKGASLGVVKPWQFFWVTGGLSSFLDNAPTYLTFFSLAQGVTENLHLTPAVAGVAENLLLAISAGAVAMGANTYIGNGPNFMVKSIVEHENVSMPHFFKYMAYSMIFLMPIYVFMTLLFFRN